MLSLCCICTAGTQTSSKDTGEHPKIWGCPNIWGHPNICGGVQTYGGYLNIQGASKHIGASKCIGAYGHPLSLTKHAFFVLCMYRGHPNIIKTCRKISKHMGDVQTYRGHPNIWGCPNIQGGIPACLPILRSRLCH